jgi:hypothetical protein
VGHLSGGIASGFCHRYCYRTGASLLKPRGRFVSLAESRRRKKSPAAGLPTTMTMMSRTSSESSLEEQSTVSSKSSKSTSRSSHRKSSLDAMITADRNRSGNQSTAKDPDRGGDDDDEEDMPSLSSFRQEDMSYRTLDDNMSLPSLSSIRIDDLSMSSSYHSHHMNESGSGEGWGSFTSGGVSGEDGEGSSEFSASSSHSPKSYATPPPPPGGVSSSRGDVIVGGRVGSTLNMPTRSTSPMPLPTRSSSPITMPKRSRSPVSTTVGTGASTAAAATTVVASCISRTSGIQKAPESPQRATRVTIPTTTEPDGSGSLPLKPARSTSPPRRNDTSEKACVRLVGSADDDENSSSDSSDQGGKPAPAAAAAPGPLSILKKNPIERSGSFPLPIRSASVLAPEPDNSSSSSLRGVDSLPRLPRRTSILEEDTALTTAVVSESDGNENDRRRRKPTMQAPAPSAPSTKSSCSEETTSATEVEEEGDDGDKEQKKQGTLTKIVKKIGKASSFRTSSFKGGMKIIGKTASKLKLKAASRNGDTSSNNNINSASGMNNSSHNINNNQSISTSKKTTPESQDKAHKKCRSKDR